jgi:hypothetical protein
LQLISLFPEQASGSPLVAACVTESLRSLFSKHTEKLMAILEDGLLPGDFRVPKEITDALDIQLGLVLLTICPSAQAQAELTQYVRTVVEALTPVKELFEHTDIYRQALADLWR